MGFTLIGILLELAIRPTLAKVASGRARVIGA